MAITQKQEARALSADERALVEKSHHPALQAQSDKDLANLLSLLRERRSKAKDQASQRRREMRGKGAAKGATPSKADEGSKLKTAVLAGAVRRLNGEVERRRRMNAQVATAAGVRKALKLKQAAEAEAEEGFNSRTAHKGMRDISKSKVRSLIRPMERGRLRKAQAVAQAKKDARPEA